MTSHVLPPVNGGGGGARVPVTVSGSPFADLPALEAWSQANPTELLNNDENVAVALVGTAPNFITYEWVGQNQVYAANQWSNETTLTPEQTAAVQSIINLPDNSVPKAVGGQLLDGEAEVNPTTSEWSFDETITVPANSIRFADAWVLGSSGATVSAHDLATDTVYRAQGDEIGAIRANRLISNRFLTGQFEVQPIDADELTDPVDATVVIPAVAESLDLGPNEDGQVISGVDLKLTTASVKTNITIRLTLNGQVFAEFFYPTATLTEAPDIYHFPYDPPVDVRVGDNLLVNTFSSDGPMIFLGRADTQVKWQRVNLALWDYEQIPTMDDIPSIADRYIRLNNSQTTASQSQSGIVVNHEPTATTDTASNFLGSIGTASGTGATCTTVGSATFSQGDIVQVSGSRYNNNIYEVDSHVSNTLEIRGVDGTAKVEDFTKDDFIYEIDSATVTKVNVSVIRTGAQGRWFFGYGNQTPLTFRRFVVEGGGPHPPADADEIYFGLSDANDPATVDISTLTHETSVTNPHTVQTGLATAGQYFIILAPNAHPLTRIVDTVLGIDVYNQGGSNNIFVLTENVRVISSVSFNSYVVGPVNAGVDEEYIIHF